MSGNQLVLGPATEMSLLTGPPDSTGGSQSALVDKLGVNPNVIIHGPRRKSPGDEQKARRDRSSETSVSPHRNQSTNQLVCLTSYSTKKGLGSLSLCAIVLRSSPPSYVFICNGQRSSQLFCVHYTYAPRRTRDKRTK
jgi:hypothetical protein